jgi:hypothetical protein
VRKKRRILKDDADTPGLRRTPELSCGVAPDVIPETNLARVRTLETRDLPQDRRLASARRAEQDEHRAGTKIDVERPGDRQPAWEPPFGVDV